jgi:hypothetical protein
MQKKSQRTLAIGTAVALVLSTLVLFVPSAAAEGIGAVVVTLEADDTLDNGRLLPETGQAILDVDVQVTVNAAGACIQQIQLTYAATKTPSYASVVFNPSSRTITVGDDGQPGTPDQPTTGASSKTYRAEPVSMIVSTTRGAPAFEDGQYEIEVKAKAGKLSASDTSACNMGEAKGTGSATIKNDYLPVTLVAPALLFAKAGQNQKLVIPVEVTNMGNGPTRIQLEAIQGPGAKLDAISVGSELRLESKASRGPQAINKATRGIEIQTPHSNGYTNSIVQFNVRFKSSFDGTAPGKIIEDEQVVAFSVQIQGVYVPGFDPTLLMGVLGVGVVGLRRAGGGRR